MYRLSSLALPVTYAELHNGRNAQHLMERWLHEAWISCRHFTRESDCCVILTAELNAQILLDDKCTITYTVVINKYRSMTRNIKESRVIVICCI